MTGERRGRVFRLGDRVDIIVMKANMEDRKIDFKLAEGGAAPMEDTRGKPVKRNKKKY